MRTATFLLSSLFIALLTGQGVQDLSVFNSLSAEASLTLAEFFSTTDAAFGLAYFVGGLAGMYALYRRSLSGLLLVCAIGGGIVLFESLLTGL